MEQKLHFDSRARRTVGGDIRAKGLLWGLVGGLVATLVIDLIQVVVLPPVGITADGGFIVIGDTAAAFFALIGIKVAGGVPLGVLIHYLVGMAFGGILGAAVTSIDALRLTSMQKGIGLGILFTEAMSLPLLVTPPIFLKWTESTAVQWFAFSFFMHAIFGTALGIVVSRGLRSGAAAREK